MSEKVTVIPKELLCLQEEDSEGTFLVRFPTLIKRQLIVRWTRDLQDYVTENLQFIIKHPESDVGIHCLREDYSCVQEVNLFIVGTYLFRRVLIADIYVVGSGLEFAKLSNFVEGEPTREKFLSNKFQEKIDRLRELEFRSCLKRVIVYDRGDEKICLPPHRLNESSVGMFVDIASYKLNTLIDEDGVKEGLVGILEEEDVEKRLDSEIILYERCLDAIDVPEWRT